MVNCQAICIKIHGSKTLSFQNDTPVLEILKSCATALNISFHYITRFTIQTESGLLLPYRKVLPANYDNFTLFAFDDLPLDELLHNNVQGFMCYFNQCKDQFVESSYKTCSIHDNIGISLHTELFLSFIRMNGLSLKRPDIFKTFKKYAAIFRINIEEEKNFLMNIINTEFEAISAKQHMLRFMEKYRLSMLTPTKQFTKFTGVEVVFENQPMVESEVLISKKSVEIISLARTVDLQDIALVSSHKSLYVDLAMENGSHCIFHLPLFHMYETFLTVLDHYFRLHNHDKSSPLSSISDIAISLKDFQSELNWFKKSIIAFEEISSKEVRLALEIYGKPSGLYGLIKNNHLLKYGKGTVYILIYCIEETICEKMICVSENLFHFEDLPHLRYTSIPALIHLSRFGLPLSSKTYPLTKQINESLISDIQYPEVKDIIVPQSNLSVQSYLEKETWIAKIYKGKLTTKQRMVTHFEYKKQMISEKVKKEFFTEAIVLAKIESENVLQILHLCVSLECTAIKYITEDIPFYTLHEHLKTEYIPTYARLDMNIRISEECTEGPMAFTLLFKYVRDIVAGLEFLHTHGIVHTLPAPQHILLDQVCNRLKLFDVGMFGKVFTSSPQPQLVIQQSEDHEGSVLRWMSEKSIYRPECLKSTHQDRYILVYIPL